MPLYLFLEYSFHKIKMFFYEQSYILLYELLFYIIMKPLIYLDYAASTPVFPEVSKKMMECLSIDGVFGNPASSSHYYGVDAQSLVENARQDIASLIGAEPGEIVWTSGATESDNLAIKGIAEVHAHLGKHIITSAIEHKAVLDTCAKLEKQGFAVTYLQPELETGVILPESVEQAIRPDTILISLMMVNNEIGTITDVNTIGQLAHKNNIIFHVDAAQAAGKTPIDVKHIDLLSLSAHKVYGPKGIGALYVKKSLQVEAQIHGGGHENGMRSGTLATHQIIGMGEAFKIAKAKLESEQRRIQTLRHYLYQELNELTEIKLNGDLDRSVQNYLNISFSGEHAASTITAIKHVVAVSSSSACNSKLGRPSHVLTALGRDANLARQSVRFSFGAYTTQEQLQKLVKYLKQHRQLKKRFVTFR